MTDKRSCLHPTFACTLLPLAVLVAALPAGAQQLSIGNYHLQSSSRSSLYQYDYTYTADLTNTGPAAQNVIGTVASSSPNTLILKASMDFGSVPEKTSITSTDTFTLRQDRRFAFDPAALTWKYQGSFALAPGTVSPTGNPQVAQYTVNLPYPGSVTISFGPDTSYGQQTWTQSASAPGPVSIFVAGMLGQTNYHMQAKVQYTNGFSATDIDHTFLTGSTPSVPQFTATTTPGYTPQRGIEQLTMLNGPAVGVVATDLQARVVWTYVVPNNNSDHNTIEGAKLLPNGHFLLTIGNGSGYPLSGTPHGVLAIREIDLAGNTIHDLTTADLTSKLKAAGWDVTPLEFHHDITPLPNGHWLALASVIKPFTDLPGYPGVTKVLGDIVVDLDPNLQPVWVWNEFDHLDVNRHPLSFPDWTHTNAVVYSPSDGNLLVSLRHQNWVVKIDYRNGQGTGGILWHLGQDGDFTLLNGITPTDWNYAQHFPSFFSPNTSGVFSLGLMDNGNDRAFPSGTVCDTAGSPPCLYTTIPVFQIDESAKTASFLFHQILPPSLYSNFGGNTEKLANGNVEYDLADTNGDNSDVFEVTPTSTPQTVWHMHSSHANAYRAYRIPSLYPGVQW